MTYFTPTQFTLY